MKKTCHIVLFSTLLVLCACSSNDVANNAANQSLEIAGVHLTLPNEWQIVDVDSGQNNIAQKTIVMEIQDNVVSDWCSVSVFDDVVKLTDLSSARNYSRAYCEMWKSDTTKDLGHDYVDLSGVPGYHSIYQNSADHSVYDIYSFPATGTGMVQLIYIHPENDDTDFTNEFTQVVDKMSLPELIYVKPEQTTTTINNAPKDATDEEINAMITAYNYIDAMPFSRKGLISQLEYEGFTHEEAVFAADNCWFDWDFQAKRKAEDYQEVFHFSKKRLIEQLEHDGFTKSQAQYGADHWKD